MCATPYCRSRSIAIVGAYGCLGSAIARVLLRHTEASVILVGRDAAALERASRDAGGSDRDRISARVASAGDAVRMAAALRGADMAVLCTPGVEHTESVARAICEAKTDCMDARYPAAVASGWERLAPLLRSHGRRCFVHAGHLPGLPSVLARYVGGQWPRVQQLRVATAMGVSSRMSRAAAREIVAEAARTRPAILRRGRGVGAGLLGARRIEFGAPWGTRTCFPVVLPEMAGLPGLSSVEEAAVYVAGMNAVATGVVLPVACALGRLGARRPPAFLGGLFAWAVNRFTKPPYGAVVEVAALGVKQDGGTASLAWTAADDDSYRLAACAVVACLAQCVGQEEAESGVRFAGHVVDPARLMQDMSRFGVRMAETRDA